LIIFFREYYSNNTDLYQFLHRFLLANSSCNRNYLIKFFGDILSEIANPHLKERRFIQFIQITFQLICYYFFNWNPDTKIFGDLTILTNHFKQPKLV
jgi:hypothetical protein